MEPILSVGALDPIEKYLKKHVFQHSELDHDVSNENLISSNVVTFNVTTITSITKKSHKLTALQRWQEIYTSFVYFIDYELPSTLNTVSNFPPSFLLLYLFYLIQIIETISNFESNGIFISSNFTEKNNITNSNFIIRIRKFINSTTSFLFTRISKDVIKISTSSRNISND